MKLLSIFLVLLLVTLQLTLWFGDDSLAEVWQLRQQINAQKEENRQLQERNAALEAEVQDLKQGLAAIEERARNELGMVKKDETFFQVVEEEGDAGK
jgi:cell division protein FtsB